MIVSKFLDIIYPTLCMNCEMLTASHEDVICFSCQIKLPYISDAYGFKTGIVSERLNQLVPVNIAYSCFLSSEDNMMQRLIKAFKYGNEIGIGRFLSGLMAENFLQYMQHNQCTFDAIIPIPIHISKRKKRGFNQSEIIGQALSEKCNVPLWTEVLIKQSQSESQTLKSRFRRMSELKDQFAIGRYDATLDAQHVLIVDDIITTGATLEKAINTLRAQYPAMTFSIATLALSEF